MQIARIDNYVAIIWKQIVFGICYRIDVDEIHSIHRKVF